MIAIQIHRRNGASTVQKLTTLYIDNNSFANNQPAKFGGFRLPTTFHSNQLRTKPQLYHIKPFNRPQDHIAPIVLLAFSA